MSRHKTADTDYSFIFKFVFTQKNIHENNTWQNFTVNEGFECAGRVCLDLARGSQNIGDLLSTGAFATNELGIARVLMHPPARVGDELA